MSDMERKPSLKERAFERLGINALRQKSQPGDNNVTSSGLLPTTSSAIYNGQSTSQKQISVSVIEGLHPVSKATEMPQAPTERKMKRQKPQGTVDYKVEISDTLESIAAQFDTTPSELAKLNKLPSRMIFPGQIIYVPDPNHDSGSELSASPPLPSPPTSSPPLDDKPRMDVPIIKMADRPPAKIPGHVERQTSVNSQPDSEEFRARKLSEEEAKVLDKECYERFIKVNVKHITDGQGVVNGVLLVTPNAIMFDPNVSDPLVIEHGPETYGMMAPMDNVISAAMYHDIAAMKLKGQPQEEHMTGSPRREIYHGRDCPLSLECSTEMPERKCYMGQMFSPGDSGKRTGAANESSELSDEGTCLCGVNKDTDVIDQSDSSINAKEENEKEDSQSETSITKAPTETKISVVSSEADHKDSENKAIVDSGSDSVTVKSLEENESENRSRELVEDSTQTKNQVNTDNKVDVINSEPLIFVDNRFEEETSEKEKKIAQESSLQQLQENLKDLDVETNEYTLDSSGTGTLVDTSGETSMYTSCSTDLSANVTDDSLLNKKESVEGPLSVSEGRPMTSSPTKPESPSESLQENNKDQTASAEPPPLTEHMQIGNITYFQYSSLEEAGIADGDGKISPLQRPPSKSEPVPMPVQSKEEAADGRASSFGSFTNSPHISAFVNYATGLFRNTVDDQRVVKDITEGSVGETTVDGSTLSHTNSAPAKPQKGLEDSDKHVAVENAIKIGDMPELFQSLDELIPRPAARTEDPPLYLCLRVGKPIHQRAHSTGPIESYSRKKKKPEYWFSIPRNKVDHLYAFFVQWSPEKYGDEEDIDLVSRGFVVVDEENPDVADDEALDIFDEYFGPSSAHRIHRDWEIVNREEFRRRSIDVYEPLPLPELIGDSAIMTEDHIAEISKGLPGRAVGYPWTLVYSTETNGFSLKTLYRNMIGLEGPVLLVVEDTEHNVFGALVACPLKMSEHFYGTGESFLFTFTPEFCMYKWSGENNFFIKGNKDSLAIGAGQGLFGLWFDEDLYHGRSNRCETYNNDPLTASEDFVLKGLEAWAFMV